MKKPIARMILGAILLLLSGCIFLYNAVISSVSYDYALSFLNILVCLPGLMLLVFGIKAR